MNEVRQHVEELLRTLKLRAVLAVYGEITENAAKNNLQYEEYLVPLLEEEVKRRQEASIKAKVAKAKFPFIKTMEEFDFSFQPGLKERKVINLASLQFIEKQENIIFLGPPGVGKTHLSVGIGIKACMARYRVLFTSTQKLIEELVIAQKDGSLMEKLLFYSRLHLLIIDELGYMPVSREQANLLFQLISIRYGEGLPSLRATTSLTSGGGSSTTTWWLPPSLTGSSTTPTSSLSTGRAGGSRTS